MNKHNTIYTRNVERGLQYFQGESSPALEPKLWRKFNTECLEPNQESLLSHLQDTEAPEDVARIKGILKQFGGVLIAVFCLSTGAIFNASAEPVPEVNMAALAQAESLGKDSATGASGEVGRWQISACVLEDYRRIEGIAYKQADMRDPVKALSVATWYMNTRIPELLRARKQAVTLTNMFWAWNAGISRVGVLPMPRATQGLIERYRKAVK